MPEDTYDVRLTVAGGSVPDSSLCPESGRKACQFQVGGSILASTLSHTLARLLSSFISISSTEGFSLSLINISSDWKLGQWNFIKVM